MIPENFLKRIENKKANSANVDPDSYGSSKNHFEQFTWCEPMFPAKPGSDRNYSTSNLFDYGGSFCGTDIFSMAMMYKDGMSAYEILKEETESENERFISSYEFHYGSPLPDNVPTIDNVRYIYVDVFGNILSLEEASKRLEQLILPIYDKIKDNTDDELSRRNIKFDYNQLSKEPEPLPLKFKEDLIRFTPFEASLMTIIWNDEKGTQFINTTLPCFLKSPDEKTAKKTFPHYINDAPSVLLNFILNDPFSTAWLDLINTRIEDYHWALIDSNCKDVSLKEALCIALGTIDKKGGSMAS